MNNNDVYKSRCTDCANLVEGSNGAWVCDESELEIHEIDECPCGLVNDYVTCDMITGTIGQWLDSNELDIPISAIKHLCEAYEICAREL